MQIIISLSDFQLIHSLILEYSYWHIKLISTGYYVIQYSLGQLSSSNIQFSIV